MKSLLVFGLAIVLATLVACSRSGVTNTNLSPSANVPPTPTPTPTPATTTTTTPALTTTPESIPDANSSASDTPTPTPPPTGEAAPPDKTPILRIDDHFVVFDLKQCRKSGSSISCEFTLTNTGPDREFVFNSYRSSLFDELGNGYRGANAQIANQIGDYPRIGFVSGVTTKARMTFEGIDPTATQITLLRLHFSVGDSEGLEVNFRNVPLLRAK